VTVSPGSRLGPYEILAPLGAGGMGEVYRARDTRLHREVAVKVLPASFSQDADRLRRFEQEARAASALNHPGILTIHDFGLQDGAPYVVSELLEGDTLREELHGRIGNPSFRAASASRSSSVTTGRSPGFSSAAESAAAS
jgi:serine/threonine protein kinase